MALAEAIGKAPANIAAECVGTPRSCYDLHASNRASVPPGPIRITDDTYAGRCGFTRAVVPVAATNHVHARLVSDRKADHGIECPRVLPSLIASRAQSLLDGGV